MNPGKRRKMQKRQFLMKKVEENRKKLESSSVVTSVEEVVQEVIKEPEVTNETSAIQGEKTIPQEVKTTKKKKVVKEEPQV